MSTLRAIKLVANDISIVAGKTATLTDEDALAQILQNKLSLWLGEWTLDTTQGIDYLGLFNQKVFLEKRLTYMLRKVLLDDTRVTKIITLDVSFDRKTREISASFKVSTTFGAVTGSI
jgi:hypothetical protein